MRPVSPYFQQHAPYPPVPPFEWPKPGVWTWTPPRKSFFGSCTGAPSCASGPACPVGVVVTLDTPPHGCDCPCHDAVREEAAKRRTEPRPAVPWWNALRQTPRYREWHSKS